MMKLKGIYPVSYRRGVHGERWRWRVISVVSSGMEFIRYLVLEMRCEGMPWTGGPHSKMQHIMWMGWMDK